VTQEQSQLLEIKSEIPEHSVTFTADDTRKIMREAVRDCALPAVPGETLKAAMYRAAKRVGIAAGRLYDIYNGEALPRWHEGETIRQRAEERRAIVERWGDLNRRRELAELRARLERLERDETTSIEGGAMADEPTLGLGRTSSELD